MTTREMRKKRLQTIKPLKWLPFPWSRATPFPVTFPLSRKTTISDLFMTFKRSILIDLLIVMGLLSGLERTFRMYLSLTSRMVMATLGLGLAMALPSPTAHAQSATTITRPEVGWMPPSARGIDSSQYNLAEALGLPTCGHAQVLKVTQEGFVCVHAATETARGVSCGSAQGLHSNGSALTCTSIR